MDALPALDTLTDEDLERLLRETEDAEETVSVRRRALHGEIDALRAERVERLRNQVEAGTLDVTPAEDATFERRIFHGTGDEPAEEHEHPAADPGALSDDELRTRIMELEREEDDISLQRRMLHGRIDIFRAERERRRRGLHVDPGDLGPILGGSTG